MVAGARSPSNLNAATECAAAPYEASHPPCHLSLLNATLKAVLKATNLTGRSVCLRSAASVRPGAASVSALLATTYERWERQVA